MGKSERAWVVLGNAFVRVAELRLLAERFGHVTDIVQQPASGLRAAGLSAEKCSAVTNPDGDRLDSALSWLEQEQHHLVAFQDDTYPDLLLQIPSPPLTLYVNGDPDVMHLPALAIVGSRNPTQGGSRNAFEFAHHLAATGFAIASGLAQGIDSSAHRGAIEAGGKTLAFLGHGIDRVYPASNKGLAHEIAKTGALISEFALGTPPEKRHFPERNRLISGIGFGTLVVEAAKRSGSLITARTAAEQGREVFAIPGSIHNPLARGCHRLIRQGAKLVETADDIVAELAPLAGHVLQNSVESTTKVALAEEVDDGYKELRKFIGHDPLTADELADQSGLTIDEVSSMLLILELEGKVESLSGGRYSLPG